MIGAIIQNALSGLVDLSTEMPDGFTFLSTNIINSAAIRKLFRFLVFLFIGVSIPAYSITTMAISSNLNEYEFYTLGILFVFLIVVVAFFFWANHKYITEKSVIMSHVMHDKEKKVNINKYHLLAMAPIMISAIQFGAYVAGATYGLSVIVLIEKVRETIGEPGKHIEFILCLFILALTVIVAFASASYVFHYINMKTPVVVAIHIKGQNLPLRGTILNEDVEKYTFKNHKFPNGNNSVQFVRKEYVEGIKLVSYYHNGQLVCSDACVWHQ